MGVEIRDVLCNRVHQCPIACVVGVQWHDRGFAVVKSHTGGAFPSAEGRCEIWEDLLVGSDGRCVVSVRLDCGEPVNNLMEEAQEGCAVSMKSIAHNGHPCGTPAPGRKGRSFRVAP